MQDVSPELIAFLREEYDRCEDETLEDERETAIDRYNGRPYGDEEDGKSQVVARDTAETVDYMVISILRTIVSGDDVVEFQHRNADIAHQATQAVKHLFMDEQDGYTVLHDWLKAGLLEKNAVAMTYGEPQPPKREVLNFVGGAEVMSLHEQGAKVIEAEQVGEDENGPVFSVAVLKDQAPKFCDAAIPNEEFYCSPDARTLTEAPLKGRKVRKTVSDLVEMGFDADELGLLADDIADTTISSARDEDRNTSLEGRRGANRIIWWFEEYARFDANGDGVAELLYIQRTSDYKVFAIEEMEDDDDHPYVDWCPFPMQHRRVGQSLADKVMDIERIRTALLRQSLDGIYIGNNPSTYVHEDSIGDNTIEDLLTVRPGRLIRWKGAQPPVERQGGFDPSSGFTMLEYMNGERESRTGITRLNQGLDADALNKTATGTALMQAQGQQVEEYLARNFANALAKLFTKKARLLKRHGKPIQVPIDGEFVEVDPQQWPEDMIARPRVGLGSGRKEQRLAYRRELIEMQMALLQAGMPIVSPRGFYNSAKGYLNDTGQGDVTEFFENPEEAPEQEEQPDPAMVKVQADMQAKQAEMQMRGQESAMKLQMEQQIAAARQSQSQAEAQAKIMLEQAKAQAQAALAQQKAQYEAMLAQAKMQQEREIAELQLSVDAELNSRRVDNDREVKLSKNRSGGDLSK